MPLPLPRRPDVVDVRICVASLLSGIGLWAVGVTMQTRPISEGWSLLPLFVMAGLELLRRTAPTFALCAGALALIADQFTTGNLATVVMFTDIVYAAVVYGTPAQARRIPVTTGLITVAVTVGFLAWFRQADAILVGAVTALVTFAPATTGVLVRNHREAADLARLRAEQTALLAEMDRTQAVTAERARMARELHDMVANHLSAIAIHSTAALSLDDPRTTKNALTVIRENSVEGLAEMRRLIGILRDSSGDLEPAAAPTLDGLGALAENARTNGLDVRLDDARTPHDAPLPAPVELAAYRIVQESLTNALKHAAPGLVTVALARERDGLRVCVSSPFGEARGPRAPGSGAGLVGMQERAALLGGTFESGPEPHPGLPGAKVWRVEARLPIDPKDQGVPE